MCWYMLVYTSIYCAFRHKDFFEISKWIQHGTRQDNKVQESPGSMCWYMLEYTSIGWYIPACTVLSGISLKSPCTALYASGYNTVQGRTRPDKEMPQSPVPLNEAVQGGTRPLYLHVPSCTALFRGTGLLGFSLSCLVLPCTVLYRVVSTCRSQRNPCV